MGWWKVRDSDDIVGDDAFSALRRAAKSVAELYVSAHGRRPHPTEWQRLMMDALQPVDDRQSMFDTDVRPTQLTLEVEPFTPRDDAGEH